MSKLDIITTLLAVLYLPVLIAASWASYRLGLGAGSQVWPQHSDYDEARAEPALFAPTKDRLR